MGLSAFSISCEVIGVKSRGGRGGASRRGGKKKASGTNAGGENPEA